MNKYRNIKIFIVWTIFAFSVSQSRHCNQQSLAHLQLYLLLQKYSLPHHYCFITSLAVCVNLTWWQSCCCFSTNCCCCCCGDVNCCRIVSRLRRLCEYQVWLHTASPSIMTHYWSLSSPQHCLTHCASPPLTSLPDTQCWAVELMRMLYAIVFDRLWSETSINSIANTHCLMMMSHCRGEQHPLIWCNNQMLLQLSSLVVSWQLDVESGYLLIY